MELVLIASTIEAIQKTCKWRLKVNYISNVTYCDVHWLIERKDRGLKR
jgi:hypothetical protein